jgi:hypothetical protein
VSGRGLCGGWGPFAALERVLRARVVFVLVVLSGLVLVLGVPGSASADESVTLTPAQVSQALFVAGDVARLSDAREGTESLVLEKVLQELYAEEPKLAAGTAEYDIADLNAALKSSAAPSHASLQLMPGNQRILAILAALERAFPNPVEPMKEAKLAVTHVAAIALAGSSDIFANAEAPKYFEPLADERANLAYTSFSPATVLRETTIMAALNQKFGEARDTLWAAASGESVFESVNGAWLALLGSSVLSSPAFSVLSEEIKAGNGALTTTQTGLLAIFKEGQEKTQEQACEHGTGQTAIGDATIKNVPRLECKGGALFEANSATQLDEPALKQRLGVIAANAKARTELIGDEQAVMTSAAELLAPSEQKSAEVLAATAQAQAQITEGEQKWGTYEAEQKTKNEGKTDLEIIGGVGAAIFAFATGNYGEGVNGLIGVAFKAWELNEENDVVQPASPEALTLAGLKELSGELAGFQQYTQQAFNAINAQVAQLGVQLAQNNYELAQDTIQVRALTQTLDAEQQTVFQLQDQIQMLFSTQVKAELQTTIDDSVGWQKRTGEALSPTRVQSSLVALNKYATEIANGALVNKGTPAYDFEGAVRALVASKNGEPGELSEDLDYLTRFPVAQEWLPGPVPATLANTTFWNEGARAYLQVMLENPSRVTPSDIANMKDLEREGLTLEEAQQAWFAHSGSGPSGNKVLDELLAKVQEAASGSGLEGHESAEAALNTVAEKHFESELAAHTSVAGNPTHLNLWGGGDPGSVNLGPVAAAKYPALTYENENKAPLTAYSLGYVSHELINAIRFGYVGAPGEGDAFEVEFESYGSVFLPGACETATLRITGTPDVIYDGPCDGVIGSGGDEEYLRKYVNQHLILDMQVQAYKAALEALEGDPDLRNLWRVQGRWFRATCGSVCRRP